jgi:hypothetical protein
MSGSVPRTNAIVTTRTHSFDGSRSIGTSETRSGIGKSSRALSPRILVMYAVQIGTAARAPVSSRPRLLGRSYPTHTPVARCGVKPMNHAFE